MDQAIIYDNSGAAFEEFWHSIRQDRLRLGRFGGVTMAKNLVAYWQEMNDPHDLQRFVDAQDDVYDQVTAELRAGRKQGHWMWYIFPQLKGLGQSAMAVKYGIASREEAQAYLQHALLGPRLLECTQLVNEIKNRSIDAILGHPDNLKFRSSMTLFCRVAEENGEFQEALKKYFGGELDDRTVKLLI